MKLPLLLALAVSLAGGALAHADDCIWTPVAGSDWFGKVQTGVDGLGRAVYLNNWGYSGISPYTPAASDSVVLGTGSTVVVDFADVAVGNLTGGAGTTLHVQDGANFTLAGTGFANAGVMRIAWGGGGGSGNLLIPGAVELSGGGSILMAGGFIRGDGTLTQDTGHTVHGANGTIHCAFINYGVVNADVANDTIRLGEKAKVNYGVMKASVAGASLELRADIQQGAGGQILADAGVVKLIATTITGGTLATANGGMLLSDYGTCGLVDVINTGYVLAQNGAALSISGTAIVNNGKLELGGYTGGAGRAVMTVKSNITFSGVGELLLDPGQIGYNGNWTLTNGAGHTIHGGGGSPIHIAVLNQGLVQADRNNEALVLDDQPKTNEGIMRATGGGQLNIVVNITQSVVGQIVADNGQVCPSGNALLSGGTLNSLNGGRFFADFTSFQVADLTNNATWLVQNGAAMSVLGVSIINNGKIEIGGYTGGAGRARLTIRSNITFSGAGEIVLAPGQIDDGGGTLTNAAGHTIHGGGDSPIHAALLNQGLIAADRNGEVLVLDGLVKTNQGTLRATNGGQLNIGTNIAQSAAGQIVADNGQVCPYANAMLSGGTLASVNGGRFFADNKSFTLTDLTNNASWLLQNGAVMSMVGSSIINNGRIELGGYTGGAGAATLQVKANMTLNGTGELVLQPGIINDTGAMLTNAVTHTIHGGAGSVINASLINQGVVQSDRAGEAIYLVGQSKTNEGIIRATGGGQINIGTDVIQSAAGVIIADNGQVNPYASHLISGGTLNSLNGGRFYIGGANVAYLSNVHNDARWLAENGAQIRLSGATFQNDATFELGGYTGGAGWASLMITSDLQLTGAGDILLSPGYITNNGAYTLTNGVAHTIRGAGNILAGITLNNQGIVEALNGTLNVQCTSSQVAAGMLTGGTWKATGGTLNVAGGAVSTNQGTVVISGASASFPLISGLADNQGVFQLESGAGFTTVGGLTNSGQIAVDAGCMLNVTGNYTQAGGAGFSGAGTLVANGLFGSMIVSGTHVVRANSGILSRLDALSIGAGARLDLNNDSMVVGGGADVAAQIKQAAALGAWDGASGITSSLAKAAATTSIVTALGYASGAEFTTGNGKTSFKGESFLTTDTLVTYTLAGDANMDGAVTFADFLALQNHYNWPADWSQGDWNYDGTASFADFLILQNNYNKVLAAGPLLPAAARPVPEPASLLVSLPALLMGLRGRRRG